MSTAVRRAIYGRMAGDTTLNALLGTPPTGYAKSIYHQEAPAGVGYPLARPSAIPPPWRTTSGW
jgi:hypothetical protein